jgi:YHS domain-containing protein
MSAPELGNLLKRIDAEFTAVDEKLKQFQNQQVQDYVGRKERMEQLDGVFTKLREIWAPRLEALAAKFGDKVQVTPRVTPSTREATFKFTTTLAKIELCFSAMTDFDVRNVILTYDLGIIPVLMKFDAHAELSQPLDQVDPQAVAAWIDDRIIDFVKTYLSLQENDLYLKDVMVEDPIAKVRFPKFAAAANLQHEGKTHYFIGEETCSEFAKSKGIVTK